MLDWKYPKTADKLVADKKLREEYTEGPSNEFMSNTCTSKGILA